MMPLVEYVLPAMPESTRRVALPLAVLPREFVTSTENIDPLSPLAVAAMLYELFVASGIGPLFRSHW
jgi:hypothetical protein